jgi:hypothetical protein
MAGELDSDASRLPHEAFGPGDQVLLMLAEGNRCKRSPASCALSVKTISPYRQPGLGKLNLKKENAELTLYARP